MNSNLEAEDFVAAAWVAPTVDVPTDRADNRGIGLERAKLDSAVAIATHKFADEEKQLHLLLI